MKTLRNSKLLILETLYSVLLNITNKIRLPFLVKLKILIGIGLLSSKAIQAQKVEFPNDPQKSDTLTLNAELKSDAVTMCYEVVGVKNYRLKEPKFKGGQRALNRFVKENVIYPEKALKRKVCGDVAVNVTIAEDGSVENSVLLKGKGFGLDEEALRLVNLMPSFKPGKINGYRSTMNKTIIIHFEIPEE